MHVVIVSLDNIEEEVSTLLIAIQKDMLEKARVHREDHTFIAKDMAEFEKTIEETPGFIKAMWCGAESCEDEIKEKTGATSRCIPFEQEQVGETCVCCGKPADTMLYWGRAY